MKEENYLIQMENWQFIKENNSKIQYTILGLNYNSTNKLRQLSNLNIGEEIEIFLDKIKRIK